MEKKIQVTIKNITENNVDSNVYNSTMKNDEIIYLEGDKTSVLLNIKNNFSIFRKNDEIRMKLNFELGKKIKGEYFLKKYSQFINVCTYTKKYENEKNYIYIEYDLILGIDIISSYIYELNILN
ncbi:MAG: hypothetical protein ACK5HL_03985 [Bacilli bacterium]